MPKVTILLPVYNGERYLSSAIESVLGQTFSDWQLIICDDCSTDGSAAIAQRFVAADPRVRYTRNTSTLGLFENYNECLKQSGAFTVKDSADYVKPFAQDDLLEPDMLARMVAVLDEKKDVALVSCARQWVTGDGATTGIVRPFSSSRKISGAEVILYNLIQMTNWVGEPSTVLFRASLAGPGFDPLLYHYGDIDYWFRIIENSNYYYIDETLCSFRRHAGSASSKNLGGLYIAVDILRLGKKYRRYLAELGETEEQFFRRTVEVVAMNVDHLVRNEALTVDKALAAKRARLTNVNVANANVANVKIPGSNASTKVLTVEESSSEDGFRQFSFHACRYITQLLHEQSALQHSTQAEIEFLHRQLADIRSSTSWKITAPLRNLTRSGRGN